MKGLLVVAVLLLTVAGCREATDTEQQNAVYYWRTELKVDETEQKFLKDYQFCPFVGQLTYLLGQALLVGLDIGGVVLLNDSCFHNY